MGGRVVAVDFGDLIPLAARAEAVEPVLRQNLIRL
jgi:hypothetical protein